MKTAAAAAERNRNDRITGTENTNSDIKLLYYYEIVSEMHFIGAVLMCMIET